MCADDLQCELDLVSLCLDVEQIDDLLDDVHRLELFEFHKKLALLVHLKVEHVIDETEEEGHLTLDYVADLNGFLVGEHL